MRIGPLSSTWDWASVQIHHEFPESRRLKDGIMHLVHRLVVRIEMVYFDTHGSPFLRLIQRPLHLLPSLEVEGFVPQKDTNMVSIRILDQVWDPRCCIHGKAIIQRDITPVFPLRKIHIRFLSSVVPPAFVLRKPRP